MRLHDHLGKVGGASEPLCWSLKGTNPSPAQPLFDSTDLNPSVGVRSKVRVHHHRSIIPRWRAFDHECRLETGSTLSLISSSECDLYWLEAELTDEAPRREPVATQANPCCRHDDPEGGSGLYSPWTTSRPTAVRLILVPGRLAAQT